jgi:hypothetical protein
VNHRDDVHAEASHAHQCTLQRTAAGPRSAHPAHASPTQQPGHPAQLETGRQHTAQACARPIGRMPALVLLPTHQDVRGSCAVQAAGRFVCRWGRGGREVGCHRLRGPKAASEHPGRFVSFLQGAAAIGFTRARAEQHRCLPPQAIPPTHEEDAGLGHQLNANVGPLALAAAAAQVVRTCLAASQVCGKVGQALPITTSATPLQATLAWCRCRT